jgi:hypothetical protein
MEDYLPAEFLFKEALGYPSFKREDIVHTLEYQLKGREQLKAGNINKKKRLLVIGIVAWVFTRKPEFQNEGRNARWRLGFRSNSSQT